MCFSIGLNGYANVAASEQEREIIRWVLLLLLRCRLDFLHTFFLVSIAER